jgi:heme/copper-type cytochrome/quinol oxidase subunit 2
MKNMMKNRLALSTVVTTLIILVVSVLLAGVVTYFAINVTSTRVQEEALSLTHEHIWVAADGSAVGAIMVTNNGGRDVVINKITVRGQECTTLFADPAQNATADIVYAAAPTSPYVAIPSDESIVLPSGETVGVMMTSPDSIGINDIGTTAAFTVFTSQAMYYRETNVQAYIAP